MDLNERNLLIPSNSQPSENDISFRNFEKEKIVIFEDIQKIRWGDIINSRHYEQPTLHR